MDFSSSLEHPVFRTIGAVAERKSVPAYEVGGYVRDLILKPDETAKLSEVIAEGGYSGMQTFDWLLAHLAQGHFDRLEILTVVTVQTGSVIPAIVGHFAVTMSFFAFAGGRLRQRPQY